jgi:hypothetical protein
MRQSLADFGNAATPGTGHGASDTVDVLKLVEEAES